MKNAKEMMRLFSLVNGLNSNRTSMTPNKSALVLALLSVLMLGSAISSQAQQKKTGNVCSSGSSAEQHSGSAARPSGSAASTIPVVASSAAPCGSATPTAKSSTRARATPDIPGTTAPDAVCAATSGAGCAAAPELARAAKPRRRPMTAPTAPRPSQPAASSSPSQVQRGSAANQQKTQAAQQKEQVKQQQRQQKEQARQQKEQMKQQQKEQAHQQKEEMKRQQKQQKEEARQQKQSQKHPGQMAANQSAAVTRPAPSACDGSNGEQAHGFPGERFTGIQGAGGQRSCRKDANWSQDADEERIGSDAAAGERRPVAYEWREQQAAAFGRRDCPSEWPPDGRRSWGPEVWRPLQRHHRFLS